MTNRMLKRTVCAGVARSNACTLMRPWVSVILFERQLTLRVSGSHNIVSWFRLCKHG